MDKPICFRIEPGTEIMVFGSVIELQFANGKHPTAAISVVVLDVLTMSIVKSIAIILAWR